MSKAKQMDLPSVVSSAGKQATAGVTSSARAAATQSRVVVEGGIPLPVGEVRQGDLGVIEVPMLRGFETGFVRRRVDIKLNREQAANLKAIQLGLEMKEARLLDGRTVKNSSDAIRWMLENTVS